MLRQLYLIFLLSCLTFTLTWAEDSGKKVKGRVCDENKQPIIGANVYWEGTQNGTTSDVDGNFELERKGDSKNLVVSYIGYMTEVTPVDEKDDAMQIILKGEIALDEVVVSERKMGTIASRTSVLQTQKITYDEICRAPAVIWRRALRQIRLSMYRTRMRLQVPGKLSCWDWREPTYKC